MKKLLIAALLVLAATPASAANTDPLSSASGFLKQCESTRKGTVEDTECVTYAAGAYAGIAAAQKFFETPAEDGASAEKKAVCAPALAPRDLRDRLVKQIKKRAKGSTAEALMQTLQTSYPCPKE